jgi:hypothetical protein
MLKREYTDMTVANVYSPAGISNEGWATRDVGSAGGGGAAVGVVIGDELGAGVGVDLGV